MAKHQDPQAEHCAELRRRILEDALDEQAHWLLAQEYLAQGRNLEAAAEFRRCVELNPEFIDAWKGLAAAYRAAGVEKEAQAAEERAQRLANQGRWL